MSEEKTEQPTRHKLRQAREEGQTAKSAELTGAVSMIVVLVTAVITAAATRDAFQSIVRVALQFVRDHDHSTENATAIAWRFGRACALAIAPTIGVSMVVGVVANVIQTGGFMFAMKPVTPDLERVDPMEGLKRIFSLKSTIGLIKMIVTAAVVGLVGWETFRWVAPLVAGSLYQPLPQLSRLLWEATLRFVAACAFSGVVLGLLDMIVQKHSLTKKLRMTKDEVKREHKEQDGDPKIKAERKRIGREFAMDAPPRARVTLANLMVVNPTHYAVAIRYAPDEHPLPRVIAKGADESAAELRRIAHEVSVPVVGNPPVARRLFKVDLDAPIPPELFETVAALLRWVDAIGAHADTRSIPC